MQRPGHLVAEIERKYIGLPSAHDPYTLIAAPPLCYLSTTQERPCGPQRGQREPVCWTCVQIRHTRGYGCTCSDEGKNSMIPSYPTLKSTGGVSIVILSSYRTLTSKNSASLSTYFNSIISKIACKINGPLPDLFSLCPVCCSKVKRLRPDRMCCFPIFLNISFRDKHQTYFLPTKSTTFHQQIYIHP